MREHAEIAALRRHEQFVEAGNAAADLVVYDLLSPWPPTNPQRMAAIRKILDRYDHVIRPDQARGIVDRLIVEEHKRRETVVRYRARQPQLPVLRSGRSSRRTG